MESISNAVKNPPSLENVMSFFGGNPFATNIGAKIESATEGSLASENWQLNMEICDMIQTDENVKDAIRAIKKRLQNNKNYTIVMYTLTVLETCVKNCNRKFHLQVCGKEFVNELVKIIGPKNDPPVVVQEKVLSLIQSWADTFKGQGPEVQGVVQIYEDLKYKGIEFPMTDLDAMAPILTPKRSVAEQMNKNNEGILHPVQLGRTVLQTPSVEECEKLKREMSIVEGNMTVFSEVLSDLKKEQPPEDLLFLEELYASSKEMQRRIGDLLSTIEHDELIPQLLHLNDELNNCFLRYGRYRKNLEKTSTKREEESLIDFVGGEIDPKMSGAIPKTNVVDDFDSFAASRKNEAAKKLYDDDILKNHKESDFSEMEEWLRNNPEEEKSTMSSSEFDKFLEDRTTKK